MTISTMASIANGLMLKQEPHREKHIWGRDDIYKMIQKKGRKGTLAGRSGQSQWSNKVYESNASGAHSENGAFATARTNSHTLSTVSGVRLSFPMQIGGDVEAYASDKKWSYMAKALDEQTEEIWSAMGFFASTHWYMNGDNVLGQVNGTPSGTTNGTFVMDEGFKTSLIRKGMFLSARTLADGAGAEQFSNGANLVVDVDRNTHTVTMADLTGLADDDHLYRDGHAGQDAPNGLRNIVSNTGTINNISRTGTGNTFYQAQVNDRGGSPLTEANLRDMGNRIKYNSNKSDDDVDLVILMHQDNAQVLFDLVGTSWRFSDKDTIELGFGDVKIHTPFGTVVVMYSPHCHSSDIYFLNPADLVFYAPPGDGGGFENAGHWYETNGGKIHSVRDGDGNLTDAKQMVRIWRYQCSGYRFDRMGVITDFT